MTEPINNVTLFCEEHYPKQLLDYTKFPVKTFIGKHVKVKFLAVDKKGADHCWVRVTDATPPDSLKGVLENDPVFNIGLKNGDIVNLKISQVEDMWAVGEQRSAEQKEYARIANLQ